MTAKEYLQKIGVEAMSFNDDGKDGAIGFVAEFSTEGTESDVKMSIIRGLLDTHDLVGSIIDKAYKLEEAQEG